MSKDGRATRGAVLHGNVHSRLHRKHKGEQKARTAAKINDQKSGYKYLRLKLPKVIQEGVLWPSFDSCLEEYLGMGACYRVNRDAGVNVSGLHEENGNSWQASLTQFEEDMSWYSVSRKLKKGPGFSRREINDRNKLSPGDRRSRAQTDVMRRTNELRPDHSRAMLEMCKAGKVSEVEALIREFGWRSTKRWEELNPGRDVYYVGIHLDSGQVHRDCWHTGISTHLDSRAPQGVRRDRVPYRSYGVGPGSTAFVRHIQVMMQAFEELDSAAVLTEKKVNENIQRAQAQNKCYPRDLRFNEWLDEWMAVELSKIDSDIAESATLAYAEHVREGYRLGRLGIHSPQENLELDSLKNEREALVGYLDSTGDASTEESLVERVKSAINRAEFALEKDSLAEALMPAIGESLVDAARRLSRERAEAAAISPEIHDAARILVARMENHSRKEEWDISGPISARTTAFLDWLENEPKRLMEKFRKLVRPIYKEIMNWPPAKDLIKFTGFGKSK